MGRSLPPGHHGADALAVGDRVDCGRIEVTEAMIDTFAAMTGDRFEIHMDEAAARRHGFAGRVAHGLLVLSLIDGLKNQAPAQLAARASLGWTWRFRRPVLAGDVLAVSYEVAAIEPARNDAEAILTLEFTVTNGDEDAVQTGSNRLLAYR